MSKIAQMYYLKNKTYWITACFLFLYFFTVGPILLFFPLWLRDVNRLDQQQIGMVFSCASLCSLVCMPVFGFITDKFNLKKYLLWFIAILLIFVGPLFVFVFTPMLQHNFFLGAVLMGIYLSLIYNSGAPTVVAYTEKVSRASEFEYARARMFGMLGWGICAAISGYLFTSNQQVIFWLSSAAAVILVLLLIFYRPGLYAIPQMAITDARAVNIRSTIALLKMSKFWGLVLYLIGVSCVYDVYDQQFANFFISFFSDNRQGTEALGIVTTGGELFNICIMFFAPLIVNRIGGKNALLIAGTIMSVRIIASSQASSVAEVIFIKILHMFEVPFLMVGLFKYITRQFDIKFSATVYLLTCCFFKQIATSLMSYATGYMYLHWSFHITYLILGCIALLFTVISAFCLSPCTRPVMTQSASERQTT